MNFAYVQNVGKPCLCNAQLAYTLHIAKRMPVVGNLYTVFWYRNTGIWPEWNRIPFHVSNFYYALFRARGSIFACFWYRTRQGGIALNLALSGKQEMAHFQCTLLHSERIMYWYCITIIYAILSELGQFRFIIPNCTSSITWKPCIDAGLRHIKVWQIEKDRPSPSITSTVS